MFTDFFTLSMVHFIEYGQPTSSFLISSRHHVVPYSFSLILTSVTLSWLILFLNKGLCYILPGVSTTVTKVHFLLMSFPVKKDFVKLFLSLKYN